ncbi:MAG TPA: molybdopterin-dependent oxidoreductase [Candidatus Ozemobacteraceae bacterium]|nr:molybdopterin-dependent oxidoreductase [Candidatus Ozemobacteraceae bacterium]HQG27297.1 molybdopterin-dependent oxidoreductase [Candidatus Ozemobacteraceae bacterium]
MKKVVKSAVKPVKNAKPAESAVKPAVKTVKSAVKPLKPAKPVVKAVKPARKPGKPVATPKKVGAVKPVKSAVKPIKVVPAKSVKPAKMEKSVVKPAETKKPAKTVRSIKPVKSVAKPAKVEKAGKPAAKPSKTGKPSKSVADPKIISPKIISRKASPIPEPVFAFDRPDAFNVVNHSREKIDGYGLVCGTRKYTGDYDMPDALRIKVLTSPHAHARIKNIDTSEAQKVPGVVAVYTWKDVPRIAHTTAGQGYPEPSPYDTFILDNKVRFVGDRVAIVAAETVEAALEACKLIKVEYEVLPAVFDPEKAMEKDAPVIHDEPEAKMPIPAFYDAKRNHCAHVDARFGDIQKAFKDADVVLERKYYTHYAHHCAIEPHVCLSHLDENDRLTIYVSTQVPFHSRRITAQALGIPLKKVRVIKPRIGGGFGSKQEVLLEDVCGFVTLKTRRPAKWELTREEEFVSARTRHPMVVTIKSGVKKNGTITGISMKILSNTGAYGSHALTVMSNCGSKVLPLYKTNCVEFIGDTVYTNLPVCGAYRGYGATQAAFAMESQMDEMAAAIGMNPLEFRKMNHIKEGETSPVFKALGEGREGVDMKIGSCGLPKCIEIGAREIGWKEKQGRPGYGPKRRGVGMCILMQGSSIPEIDMGAAFIKMNDDGSFNMMVGATDLGTGSDTILAQIAAETLGCDHDDIVVYSSDTDFTPFDTGAYASSTTYLSGGAVIRAAEQVRDQIKAVAAAMLNEPVESITIEDKFAWGKNPKGKLSFGQICRFAMYEYNQFQIAAIGSHVTHASPPPFSAHFAEVEVDIETGEVKVLKYVAAVDCGTAINPQLADGQTQGGTLNGISFALTEEFVFDGKGRLLNPTFKNYKIFSTADLPELKTFLVPTYEPTGPYGAKSVSEICINGPLPAIANAIRDAVGIRLTRSPFTPEKVLRALREKAAGTHA